MFKNAFLKIFSFIIKHFTLFSNNYSIDIISSKVGLICAVGVDFGENFVVLMLLVVFWSAVSVVSRL